MTTASHHQVYALFTTTVVAAQTNDNGQAISNTASVPVNHHYRQRSGLPVSWGNDRNDYKDMHLNDCTVECEDNDLVCSASDCFVEEDSPV